MREKREEITDDKTLDTIYIPEKKELEAMLIRLDEDIKLIEKEMKKQGVEASTEHEAAKMRRVAIQNRLEVMEEETKGGKKTRDTARFADATKEEEAEKPLKTSAPAELSDDLRFEDLAVDGMEKFLRNKVKSLGETIKDLEVMIALRKSERNKFKIMLDALEKAEGEEE